MKDLANLPLAGAATDKTGVTVDAEGRILKIIAKRPGLIYSDILAATPGMPTLERHNAIESLKAAGKITVGVERDGAFVFWRHWPAIGSEKGSGK